MDRLAALLIDVDRAFARTGSPYAAWADPHPDRSPLEVEYSRLLDPGKWRIVGARVDAWIGALVAVGLADAGSPTAVEWLEPLRTDVHHTDVLIPCRRGAVPLVVARHRIGGVDGAGVTIAAGDPAVAIEMIPDCGCDACDSGSQEVLDQVDRSIGGVVRGEFRQLWRRVRRPPRPAGFRFAARVTSVDDPAPSEPAFTDTWAMPDLETITVISDDLWSASNVTGRRTVDEVLADPTGWHVTAGAAWLGDEAT